MLVWSNRLMVKARLLDAENLDNVDIASIAAKSELEGQKLT